MLKGYATPEGTQLSAARAAGIDFVALGPGGLTASAAGFGGYRIAAGVAVHGQSLAAALTGGINLVDTSANYADGESERLIGQVLAALVADGRLEREALIVVSKAGYLQGRNLELSQARKRDGNPFPEVVEYDRGLSHCIHPEFLADQLTRSLERLQLDTLDVYLLHNPEYYLGWAQRQGIQSPQARDEYYRRIKSAFTHLEEEVEKGRIRAYGVSSNTFAVPAAEPQWTSLAALIQAAREISEDNHFQVIQLPLNLLERGAVLEANQPDGSSVLESAIQHRLGVLINRPLNAVDGQRMLRLSDIAQPAEFSNQEITDTLMAFRRSEKRFMRSLLPRLEVPAPMQQRITDQLAVADHLVHYWRNFGSYEQWRQVRGGFVLPRVMGVFQYLQQHAGDAAGTAAWIETHQALMEKACQGVESVYAGRAIRELAALARRVRAADHEWGRAATLSQMALRAVRSTSGVSSVLVGMRHPAYVEDVLAELRRPLVQVAHTRAWRVLAEFDPDLGL